METTIPPDENETIPPQVPAWEDFVDIYLEPAQVFARRAAGRFGPALIVLTIMSAILAAGTQMALSDALTADIQRAMANSSAGDAQMSPEALEQMQRFGMLGAVVGSLVFVPVGVLVSGFVIWLLGMAVDAALTFGAAAMIATFAAFPRLLQALAGIIQGLFMEPDSLYDVALGIGRFYPRDGANPILLAFVDRADLFSLWAAILVGIGVHVVGRVPKGRAFLVAAIFWVLAALPAILPALVTGQM